jgi:hypothetical protein
MDGLYPLIRNGLYGMDGCWLCGIDPCVGYIYYFSRKHRPATTPRPIRVCPQTHPPETLTLDFRNKIIVGSGITQWVITTLTVFHRPIIFYTHCVPGPGYRSESALALADSTKSQTYITDLDTPRGASAQNRVHAQEVIDDNDMPGLCIRPYSAPSYGA